MWTLDFDDFTGTRCNQGKYPLLNAVAKQLTGSTEPVPTIPIIPPVPTVPPPKKGCRPVGAYARQPGMKKWCVDNCALGNCPRSHCTCKDEDENESDNCEAVGAWKGQESMKKWCITNCAFTPPNCPSTMCAPGCIPSN